MRVILYYAYTLKKYIADHKLYVYGGKAIPLPAPEFYVIYTGNHPIEKDVINLADEFFPENRSSCKHGSE